MSNLPYSPSRLSAFEHCELRGKFYCQRAPVQDAELRDIGSATHAILHDRAMQRPVRDLSQFPASIIAQAYEIADRVAVQVQMEGVDIQFEFGAAVDAQWQVCPWDSPGAYLRCVFDVIEYSEQLIDGEYYGMVAKAWDYKSGWRSPKADSIQGMVQVLILHALYPEAAQVEANFQNIRTGAVDCLALTFDEIEGPTANLGRYRQIVTDKINRAEKSTGAPNVGGACVTCPYHAQCDAFRESATAKLDATDPYKLAQQYIAASAHLDDLTDRLKAMVEVVGNLSNGGYEIGYLPTEQSKVDKAALVKAWTDGGGDMKTFLDLLDVGKTGAGRIFSALAKQTKQKKYQVEAQFVTTSPGRRWGMKRQED